MAGFQKTIEQRSPFLALPYEIRHLIYSTLYPIGQEIVVDDKEVMQITNRHGPLKPLLSYPNYETNLLLACGTINKEITTMHYGKNAFAVQPGTSVYQYSPIRCELFLSQLRPVIASKVKKLHIYLGPGVNESFVGALIPGIARFPHVEIRITRFRVLPETRAQELRVLIEQACRLIAGARSGAETIWDAWGEKETVEMLDAVMPNGYQKKT